VKEPTPKLVECTWCVAGLSDIMKDRRAKNCLNCGHPLRKYWSRRQIKEFTK